MSESVWYEQVDTALIKFIKDILTIEINGVNVVVPVTPRKSEEDFKKAEFPCVTIYNLYDTYAVDRYSSDDVVLSKNANTFKIVVEKSAIPYDLVYQIDFWSKTQVDMNTMTRLWLSKVARYFNLTVLDMSGKERSCFVLLKQSLMKQDLLTGTNRTFHSVLTYKVQVELDEKVSAEKDMVVNIQVDANKI